MRVISGILKGRRLRSPWWQGLRPTSDRLRETLFNILGDSVLDAMVLDAYAGTGALGIEAISRGARRVVFIEGDERAAALIVDNLKKCEQNTNYQIVCEFLPSALDRDDLPKNFDLILLDPPYDEPEIGGILSSVGFHLSLNGMLVLERSRHSKELFVSTLKHVRRVVSGGSSLDFYCRP